MPSLGSTAPRAAADAAASAVGLAARARERGLGCRQPQRPIGDRARADARLGDHAVLDAQRARDRAHGVVAVARSDLGEARAPAGAGRREAHLGDDLVGLEAARQVRHEELLGRDEAHAGRPRDLDGTGQRLQQQRQLRRSVGVGDRAADRAAVAGRDVPDVGQRQAQQRAGRERRSCRSRSRCVHSAPTRTAPSARSIIASAGIWPRSTSMAGALSRKLSSGTRLWPPASTFASSPCSASSASASASERGRWSRSAGGFTGAPRCAARSPGARSSRLRARRRRHSRSRPERSSCCPRRGPWRRAA